MQCPRCFFTNAAGARACEYCGARLDPTADTPAGAGSASTKRVTMLGPAPRLDGARPAPRLDPDDPFRIAARGIAPPEPTAPTPPPPDAPAPPPSRAHRPTVVTLPQPAQPALAGVALVIGAQGDTRAVILREGRARIGRRADAEIPVEDERASTEHALLRVEGGRAWLLDTSANGTLVSGVLCLNDRAELADGSVLEVGAVRIVLKLLGEDSLTWLARS